jgi:hypothetical protein
MACVSVLAPKPSSAGGRTRPRLYRSGGPGRAIGAELPGLAALTAAWAFFFAPFLAPWSDGPVFPAGDFTLQFHTFRQLAAARLAAGQLPLWLDCAYGGVPFQADPQSQLFYPPAMAIMLAAAVGRAGRLPIEWLQLEALAHIWLAGVLTYAFLRTAGRSRWAGVLGGVSFSLGGYLTGYPPLQLAMLETAVWLPAVLLGVHQFAARHTSSGLVVASAALGLSALAGHPQTLLMASYLTLAYGIYVGWHSGIDWRATAWRAILPIVAGTLLAAVQLLPTLAYVVRTIRGPASLSFDQAGTGFPPADSVQLLVTGIVSHWQPLYVGLLPLGLAAAAAAGASRDSRFWVAVVAVGLLLSLGAGSALFDWARLALPGYGLFRSQERHALIVSLALSILAARGADLLLDRLDQSRHARGRPIRRGVLAAAVLGLLVADLSLNNAHLLRAERAPVTPPAAIVGAVDRVSGEWFRIQDDYRLAGHEACRQGWRELGGVSPVQPAAYKRFTDSVPEHVRWRLLGVRYLITWRGALEGASLVAKAGAAENPTYMWQLRPARRAWVVRDVRSLSSGEVIRLLSGDQFQPDVTAAVTDGDGVELRAERGRRAGAALSDEVAVRELSAEHLVIEADLARPGLVVLSEQADPDWRAWLDGHPVRVYTANAVLRGVVLPAGRHLIDLRYRPRWLVVGAAVSVAAGLCLVAVWLVSAARRRV